MYITTCCLLELTRVNEVCVMTRRYLGVEHRCDQSVFRCGIQMVDGDIANQDGLIKFDVTQEAQ